VFIYLPGDVYTNFNFGRNHSTFFGVKTTGKLNVKICKAWLSYHDYFLHVLKTSTKNPEISHDVQSLPLNI
jgi:hypothetical protein